MKKTHPAKVQSKAKNKRPKDFNEYVASVPPASRKTLKEIRAAIKSVVPRDAVEVISYGIPAFRLDRVLVWYAAFAGYCSFFPTAAVIEKFQDDLKGFSIRKGTVHFPVDMPVPVALIKKMVTARTALGDRLSWPPRVAKNRKG
jgi:uncharacterized protein YdhG (YjbR/CyaY superfamily)